VAAKVREARKARGWQPVDLALRCEELGNSQLTENVIENIESGRRDASGRRRRAVTVDELYTLAAALGLAPMQLFIPGEPGQVAEALEQIAALADRIAKLHEDLNAMGQLREMIRELDQVRDDETALNWLTNRPRLDGPGRGLKREES
jgi:transcriptional regulator with XRE-family HTH domain